jgi:hypothetical protein
MDGALCFGPEIKIVSPRKIITQKGQNKQITQACMVIWSPVTNQKPKTSDQQYGRRDRSSQNCKKPKKES